MCNFFAEMVEETFSNIGTGLIIADHDKSVATHVQMLCIKLASLMQTLFHLLHVVQDASSAEAAQQLAAASQQLWEVLSNEQQVTDCPMASAPSLRTMWTHDALAGRALVLRGCQMLLQA